MSSQATTHPSILFYSEADWASCENVYIKLSCSSRRKYPNEELCRFMGRNFFHISAEKRQDIRILETGCGYGGNLWMIAKEGFDAYGIDLSPEAIILSKKMLDDYGVRACLSEQNMVELSFPENYFDAIVDVFSSYCLTAEEHGMYLEKVKNVLKPGGIFFSYFPSKISDAYLFPQNAKFIDPDTLACISREDAPFYGQTSAFRFMHPREYENKLTSLEFGIQYIETIKKTYKRKQENFGFIVIEAVKNSIIA